MVDDINNCVGRKPSYGKMIRWFSIIILFCIVMTALGWSAWQLYKASTFDPMDGVNQGSFSGSFASPAKRQQLEQMTGIIFPEDAKGTFRASWEGFLDWTYWAKIEGSETMIKTTLQDNGFPKLELLYNDEINCPSSELHAEDFWPQESWWKAAELQNKENSCKMLGEGMHLTFVVCGRTSEGDYVMYMTRIE